MSNKMTWSTQQQAFINWAVKGKGSCVLEAVAGAGKTTTLLEAAVRMPGGVAVMAYNKKIAEEIRGKLDARGVDFRKVQAGTVHSFGFSAYRKAFPKVVVKDDKVVAIVDLLVDPENPAWRAPICNLVLLAKQAAFGVVSRIDDESAWLAMAAHHDVFDDLEEMDSFEPRELVRIAIRALKASNANTAEIDFDDMVYLPLVHRVRFWRYDIVMVDEAQDTNAARRALVRAALMPGGRVVAVGDSRQAIYGFTGADSDSLDLIAADFGCVRLPLTTTYRCPKTVVEFARQWVSHITAADTAPVGVVQSIDVEDFIRDHIRGGTLNASAAILCRNTKPLVSLAFGLISLDVPCRVEGREIGAGLKKLASRWATAKTTEALRGRLETFLSKETTKLLARGQEGKLQQIADQVETLFVIIDRCEAEGRRKVAHVLARIDSLFDDDVSGLLTLSTIHKSKGREWDTVYWLDRAGTCPSKYARQEWQKVQEDNLCYVAATRAKNTLIELPDMADLKKAAEQIAAKKAA